jgi:hypothetical protein
MNAERRNQIVLAVLLVVLAVALYRAWWAEQPVPATSGGAVEAPRAAGGPTAIHAPDVRLEALDLDRARPGAGNRNLFRFRSRATAPEGVAAGRGLPPPPPPPAGPPPAPGVPPIALKFIGVVEATGKSQTYAVLRDDRGVYHGREGDVIEGRYRILRIGAESVELAYVDGRGRQTLRLGS